MERFDTTDYQPLAPKLKGEKKRQFIREQEEFIAQLMKKHGVSWEELYGKEDRVKA